MEELLKNLKSKNRDEFLKGLQCFIDENTSVTSFEFLNKDNLREEIWESIFSFLSNEKEESIQVQCLIGLRILSRDKTNIDEIMSKYKLDLILKFAELDKKCDNYRTSLVINEAQKLLCNILFNSTTTKHIITDTMCLECVLDRLSKSSTDFSHDTKLFDVRIIFLITALNELTRNFVSNDLCGILIFTQMLENVIKVSDSRIEDNQAILVCEVLKALFNLLIDSRDPCERNIELYKRIIFVARGLLLLQSDQHKENLQSNVVNVLTTLPMSCYSSMIAALDSHITKEKLVYLDADVTEINVLLNFLNNKLDCKIDLVENLSPILTALINMCRAEKLIRKYVRMQVLPPLKDVLSRPEEGTKLRNKCCKLLTSPVTRVRDLVAEFLFVLCKEKVGRMIKYTGYGNAAGLLASKGLLIPTKSADKSSSESEGSETEEYEKYKEQINPVIGCYESPHPNPLEGMTEEQKEYEAMKLVGLVDQLSKQGIIQPCKIGDDGKPEAVHHILELQDTLPKQLFRQHLEDSD